MDISSALERLNIGDINLDGIDFNDPAHFAQLLGAGPGGLPIPKYQSPTDVRKEATERSAKIHANYGLLRGIVSRHEAVVQKRWIKKSKQQKLKILLDAWPGMPSMHRPDFDAFRKETERERDAGTRYKQNFMWPYINQEDLSKPKNLLWLINSRGRHHPSLFAAADIEATSLGRVSKAVVPIFLNQHVMILHGATDAQSYGELVAWDDHPDAFEWMHTMRQFIPGEGLLVLEIQERLLDFLVQCCGAILHDVPADTLTSGAVPLQPEPHLKAEAEATGFESLAVMAAEAPYRVPARPDFARIEALLEAKTLAAKDHIWALREDPAYLSEIIGDIKEHRQEMLKDTRGKTHPALEPLRDGIFWARITGTLVVQAYVDLEVFSELHRLAKQLRLLHGKYAAQITPADDLPGDLLTAILRFRHYLNQAAKHPLYWLRTTATSSPPMRKLFIREPPPNATTSQIFVISKSGVKLNRIENELLWLLRTLWEDSHTLFLTDMTLVVDELERLLQAEPQAADLVSARVADHIGSLAIISQCLNQLKLFQPWARGYEAAWVDRSEGIEKEYKQWFKHISSLSQGLKDENVLPIGRLADPSNKRFHYPTDKRRTKENVEALRRAEQSADEFWAAVDKLVLAKCGYLAGTTLSDTLSEQRVLQRTPEWIDDGMTAANKQQAANDHFGTVYEPLSTTYYLFHSSATRDTAEPGKRQPKTKTKTKGVAREEPTPRTADDAVPEESQRDPIPVDARSLKVFRTLFFNPGVTSSPGEVSWHDFVHAMTSTSLFAAEKLYGSVWQFQRLDEESQSRIQFHQPHPRGKIPFTMARRYGRRLTRNFGWSGALFVLRDSEGVTAS
jgi:hypothetical protein